MPRSCSFFASLAAAASLALAGCGPDPCSAARQWASVCGLDPSIDEAEFRKSCEESMASCNDSQKGEVAGFYQCLSANKVCAGAGMQTCAQNVTFGAASCINSFK